MPKGRIKCGTAARVPSGVDLRGLRRTVRPCVVQFAALCRFDGFSTQEKRNNLSYNFEYTKFKY